MQKLGVLHLGSNLRSDGFVEVIPMEIKLPSAEQSQRPWMKFAGVFKDDPDFDAVQQYIQEYRQELDAEERVKRLSNGEIVRSGECCTNKF